MSFTPNVLVFDQLETHVAAARAAYEQACNHIATIEQENETMRNTWTAPAPPLPAEVADEPVDKKAKKAEKDDDEKATKADAKKDEKADEKVDARGRLLRK